MKKNCASSWLFTRVPILTNICYMFRPKTASKSEFDTKNIESKAEFFICFVRTSPSGFSGLVVSMLASGTQVRGFKPD
jgi:hypothetical protein